MSRNDIKREEVVKDRPSNADVIADLTRAKALFQQRTILTILSAGKRKP